MARQYRFLFFLLALVLLSGCARSDLTLKYVSPPPEVFPQAGSTQVCVVRTEDGRSSRNLGSRSDGSGFSTSSDVEGWVSHALAAELARQGVAVTTANSVEEAKARGAKVILRSRIDEISLNEASSISYSCSMRLYAELLDQHGAAFFQNTFTSSISKQVVPMPGVAEDILKEALEELVRPAGARVAQKVH